MSFISKGLARAQRTWQLHPASFPLRATQAVARGWVGGPRPLRLLLVSDGKAYTSEQQWAPFSRHASALRSQLGLVTQQRLLPDALGLDAAALRGFDLIGLKLHFSTPAPEAERIARHFAAQLAGARSKLVYFDGDDDPNVLWHGVLDAVDLCVKKHVFADPADYTRSYVGKTNLTDYVHHLSGTSFAEDIIPASGNLPPALAAKLHLGWSIALDDKIAELARNVDALPHPARDIDLSCRAYVPPTTWTHPMRLAALQAMESLGDRLRILAPRDRVPQDVYYQEMLRSRMCVSPFGYGEICWRDFEAILCGCLLVKPDMGHVRSLPDVFQPHVTYVPVRWDCADLEAQCAPYLADEQRRLAMATAARQALLQSLEPAWFVARIAELLVRLELLEQAAQARLAA